jgi:hypothetical protein
MISNTPTISRITIPNPASIHRGENTQYHAHVITGGFATHRKTTKIRVSINDVPVKHPKPVDLLLLLLIYSILSPIGEL